jgi:hypothetical protein
LRSSNDEKLRCNVCSRLCVTRHARGTGADLRCRCGCKAFWVSRITLLERLLFRLGWYSDAVHGVTLMLVPLGGTMETLERSQDGKLASESAR